MALIGMWWTAGALILFIFLFKELFSFFLKWRKLRWVPGPPTIPLLGNCHQLVGNPEEFFSFLRDCHMKYGGIYKLWLFTQPFVLVQHVDFIQALMRDNKNIKKAVEYEYLRPFIGEGLLLSTGEKWLFRRKLLTPSFHLGILESMTLPMVKAGRTLVELLKQHSEDENSFDIKPYIKLCALDIMMETSVGRKIDAQRNPLSRYVKAIETMSKVSMLRMRTIYLRSDWLFRFTPLYKVSKEAEETIRAFSKETIIERRRRKEEEKQEGIVGNQPPNIKRKRRMALLDLLLEVEKEEGLTDSDIQEEVDTFVFEGHDTTSSGVTFALFLLGHHSDFQDKIVEELDEIVPGFLENGITTQQLSKLEFLEKCVKETLRLYPSALLISRDIITPIETEHGMIPVGSSVMMDLYAHHRNPEFFPYPEKFDPNRFSPENNEKRHPYAYVPFSAGPRNCIGQKFALMEMKILVASVLKNFKVKSLQKQEELKLIANLIIANAEGIFIELSRRT